MIGDLGERIRLDHLQARAIHHAQRSIRADQLHAFRLRIENALQQPLPRRQFTRLAAQFQVCHHLPAQHAQRLFLGFGQLPGHTVNDAERAQRLAFGRQQRRTRIKTDAGIAGDEGIVGKALVRGRVRHDEEVRLVQGVRAKGHVARRFAGRQPGLRFEPLPFLVHQRNQRNGRLADVGRERGQIVERLLRQCVQQLVAPERFQARGFVGR